MTAANATEEAAKEGKSLNIPYWRTLKADGFLNEKYPGGAEAHKRLLEREGFKIIQKGRKFVDFSLKPAFALLSELLAAYVHYLNSISSVVAVLGNQPC